MDDSFSRDAELIKNHCKELFSQRDYVIEPQVISTMLAFFRASGSPQLVVDLLATNYSSCGQIINILISWLSELESADLPSTSQLNSFITDGYSPITNEKIKFSPAICDILVSIVTAMIMKTFCADTADKIFESETGERGIDWLPDLIAHRPWRQLIFQLSEQYPNCLMLNFAVKLISDAGYQKEICNVSMAVQQLDIFSRVFLSAFIDLLSRMSNDGLYSDAYRNSFVELFRFAYHSDQTVLYTQALLHVISKQKTGRIAAICNHIAQKLRLELEQNQQKVSALSIAIIQSESDRIPQNVISAILTMIQKCTLNPADINQLYKVYFDPYPPPIDLIRNPLFLDILVDALFNPTRPTIHSDYRPKYVYLLAYAGCVGETTRNGIRQSKAELETTRCQANELTALLHNRPNVDLLASLSKLKELIAVPILAACVLHHIRTLLLCENSLNEPQLIHFALIDWIATLHANLHENLRVFDTLCLLYAHQSACNEVAESVMTRQRGVIDRFVHLLLCGHTTTVIERISKMFSDGQIDVSLVRYFCMEVLDSIGLPYSPEFQRAFLPLVGNAEVFDASTLEKQSNATEFIGVCRQFS